MEETIFKHTISKSPDGQYYLMRDNYNMVCWKDRKPYIIDFGNNKKKLVNTYCTSSCPCFHLDESNEFIALTCTLQETLIKIDEIKKIK